MVFLDPIRPQGGAGRGKDMSNILNAEQKRQSSVDTSAGEERFIGPYIVFYLTVVENHFLTSISRFCYLCFILWFIEVNTGRFVICFPVFVDYENRALERLRKAIIG